MERIGIAASKIAKGNLVFYNLYVIVISFLFSLFLFFIAGSSIVVALIIIGFIVSGGLPAEAGPGWNAVIYVCMGSLAVVVGIVTFFAILRNIKFKK